VIFDARTGRATGVQVIDSQTQESHEFRARIIFINASTIATTAILLRSISERFPNGLGNDSGLVGLHLMDHHSSAGATGIYEGFENQYYSGRRPCGFLIPRFRNVGDDKQTLFTRGYQVQGVGKRLGWQEQKDRGGFGKSFKEAVLSPGSWTTWMGGWGECLPSPSNRVYLDTSRADKWGLPMIVIDFAFGDNETKMQTDIQDSCAEMLEGAGFKHVNSFNYTKPGGNTVHEMGTARMGHDPKTSVLNKFNQMHAVKNVFITDGSCMTSSACQNPSLTYMALTARACAYAVDQLKRGVL
jgi:choline dehydrogenase-like flavoprotein